MTKEGPQTSKSIETKIVFQNTILESKEIKDNLITTPKVIYATTLDNHAWIPFGVWYWPKCVSGKEMLQSFQKSAKTIQTCEQYLNNRVQQTISCYMKQPNAWAAALTV